MIRDWEEEEEGRLVEYRSSKSILNEVLQISFSQDMWRVEGMEGGKRRWRDGVTGPRISEQKIEGKSK